MRLPNWQARLTHYLSTVARTGFRPGVHDCWIWFNRSAEAMTGVDRISEWIGKYHSIAGGMKILKEHGFDNHVDYVASIYPEIHPAFARRGDGAALAGEFGIGALGIIQGEGVYVLTRNGQAIVSRSHILRAFQI